MHQPRVLSRGEALLRDWGTGSSNLAAAPNVWHTIGPRFTDERFNVGALVFTIAGQDLLSNIDAFGGAAALEVGIELSDEYGAVRDMATVVPLSIASGQEWKSGTHAGTQVYTEAGTLTDGSARVGLRGVLILSPVGAPSEARWDSEPIPLGRTVTALSWDAWLLRDTTAATIAAPRLEMRTGNMAPDGSVSWGPYASIASTAADIDAGHATLPTPLQGDMMQFRAILPYAAPATAAGPRETTLRTATLFSLCAWVELVHSRWHFTSLAELIERSEVGRHGANVGWGGAYDVLILRIPLMTGLRGARKEKIGTRLTAGGAIQLKHLEVQAVADLRFETAEG